ncbi:MAG TPA: phosphohydrolase, partial [Verrucomicrobia bacterium]|nr:phosphohydrolase [Verrucomicrobiota bacterium]
MPTTDDTQQEKAARQLVERLRQAGHTAFWAGGCVRDKLLGRPPRDIDIATNAVPDSILEIFPHASAVGKSFGVMIVPCHGFHFETATFRQDHGYQDGRHPTSITFSTPEDDAARRDFTINAMFFDPLTGTIHDFVNGRADLAAHCIRCVGDPDLRFAEDHLRLLRAVRFATTLDFALDPATEAAIIRHAPSIAQISMERIRDEFTRTLLEAHRPGQALRMLDNLGLLSVFLPEVSALKHQAQPPEFHPEGDVLTHTVMMLDAMDTRTPTLAYAILLHDIGKPGTAFHDGQRLRFHGHAEHGARLTESILRRLRLPNKVIADVTACVGRHMRFMDVQKMRRSTLRQLVGSPTFETELELHRLDCLSSNGLMDNHRFVCETRDSFAKEPVLPDPWINGRDLIGLGVKAGPAMGNLLKTAYER